MIPNRFKASLIQPPCLAQTDAPTVQQYARFVQDRMPPPRVSHWRQVRCQRAQHQMASRRMGGH